MLVIIPYFNFFGSTVRRDITLRTVDFYKKECDVLVVSCGPVLGSSRELNVIGDVLWQKERLINIGLVWAWNSGFKQAIYADGDATFKSPYWLSNVEIELSVFDMVQCWSVAYHLGSVKHSYMFNGDSPAGGVWAFNKSEFRLYEYDIVGGGDTCMVCGLLNRPMQHYVPMYGQWKKKLRPYKVGCVHTELLIEEHGTVAGRQYGKRYSLIKGLRAEHFKDTPGAGLQWASHRLIVDNVYNYMYSRYLDESSKATQ